MVRLSVFSLVLGLGMLAALAEDPASQNRTAGLAGPNAAVEELGPLHALAGHWTGTYQLHHFPKPGDVGQTITTETDASWQVKGSHLVSRIRSSSENEIMIVWSYDAEKKLYTRTFYLDGGGTLMELGTYDKDQRTFRFESFDPDIQFKTTSTVHLESDGSITWRIEAKGKDGNKLELAGKNERTNKSAASAP